MRLPLELLFHGHDLIALNKPVGLLSQATRGCTDHVVAAAYGLMAQHGLAQRELWLVHRLDRDTSGVMVLATSKGRASYLADAFRGHRVRKTYLALCRGLASQQEFTVQAPLARFDAATGAVRVDHAHGRAASTAVCILAANQDQGISLALCRPATGRTHQIRVHLAISGLPLLGDQVYGQPTRQAPLAMPAEPSHHLLHAHALEFCPAPGQPTLQLCAPLSPVFAQGLQDYDLESALASLTAAGNRA